MFLQYSGTLSNLNIIYIVEIIKINKKVLSTCELSATWSLDVFCSKPGHPMERCTWGGLFIWFEQEMQEFGGLDMLSGHFLCPEHAQ